MAWQSVMTGFFTSSGWHPTFRWLLVILTQVDNLKNHQNFQAIKGYRYLLKIQYLGSSHLACAALLSSLWCIYLSHDLPIPEGNQWKIATRNIRQHHQAAALQRRRLLQLLLRLGGHVHRLPPEIQEGDVQHLEAIWVKSLANFVNLFLIVAFIYYHLKSKEQTEDKEIGIYVALWKKKAMAKLLNNFGYIKGTIL